MAKQSQPQEPKLSETEALLKLFEDAKVKLAQRRKKLLDEVREIEKKCEQMGLLFPDGIYVRQQENGAAETVIRKAGKGRGRPKGSKNRAASVEVTPEFVALVLEQVEQGKSKPSEIATALKVDAAAVKAAGERLLADGSVKRGRGGALSKA